MRRGQLDELLRDVGRAVGRPELVVIGSQAVHAYTDAVPAEVLVSLECDLLLEEADPAGEMVRERFGARSAFHAEHGYSPTLCRRVSRCSSRAGASGCARSMPPG